MSARVDRPADGHGQPPSDEQLALDLVLILMYLSSWTERPGEAPRFWKGFRFKILNQLDHEGLIQDSRRAKPAYMSDAGVRRQIHASCSLTTGSRPAMSGGMPPAEACTRFTD